MNPGLLLRGSPRITNYQSKPPNYYLLTFSASSEKNSDEHIVCNSSGGQHGVPKVGTVGTFKVGLE